MLNSGCALLAILGLTSTGAFAQTSIDSCSASPEELRFQEEPAKSSHPIELLREKLAANPKLPWAYHSLLELYSSADSKDAAK